MRRYVKTGSLLLAALLLLGLLSGCGGGTDTPSAPVEDTPEYVYVASYKDIELPYDNMSVDGSPCMSAGRVYFSSNVETGEMETYEYVTGELDENGEPVKESYTAPVYKNALFSMAADGTDVREMTNYKPAEIPEGEEGSSYIYGVCADKDGNLWVCEQIYTYHFEFPEGIDESSPNAYDYYVSEEKYTLRKLDATGAELVAIDLSFMQGDEEYFYLAGFQMDGEGNIYLANGNTSDIVVLNSSGEVLFKLEAAGSWINGMVGMPDGSVAVISYDEMTGGYVLKAVDTTAKAYGKTFEAPYNAYNFITGSGEYDLYYNTGTSLFGYNVEKAEETKLLTWINCDVDSDSINAVMPQEDGSIVCISNDWSGDMPKTELITMTKTPYSETEAKTVLTYACMYLDYNVRAEIIRFNRTSPDCRIEVQDYSEYNTNDDWNAGITKLTTEIISGKIPDLLAVSNLPIDQYAAKGLLEDLWPFIDADTELGGREALVAPLFAALESEGKLYQIAPSFSVMTAYGLADVVGAEPGWTLDGLYAAYEKLPEGAAYLSEGSTKDTVLAQMIGMYLDDMVNWETGECRFDSQQFIDVLKFADKFPAEFDWDKYDYSTDYTDPKVLLDNGELLMNQFYLYSFNDYVWSLGPDLSRYTFVGYPTADGSVGSAFSLDYGMSMSAACKNKDAAWSFMRVMLTEDYQNDNVWSMASNQKAMDAQLKQQMTADYYTDPVTGEMVEQPKYSYIDENNEEVKIYAMDQQTADKLMSIIQNTTRTTNYDENLTNIINDECAAFFAGQKSAEDTAKMIQSRVSLYVNEQR